MYIGKVELVCLLLFAAVFGWCANEVHEAPQRNGTNEICIKVEKKGEA